MLALATIIGLIVLALTTWRLTLCHRRLRRNEQDALWSWFDYHHESLIEQQRQQVQIIEEVADNVIYLADYAKRGRP